MPSSKNYQRDYEQEAANETPQRRRNRILRMRARRAFEKANGEIPAGYDLDHKKPLSKGGSNDEANWRVLKSKQNRSFARTRTGRIK